MKLALALALVAGCAGIPASTAMMPPLIGAAAMKGEERVGHASLAAGPIRGDAGHAGGWGVALDTSSATRGFIAHGKVALGRYGRDGLYGSTGAEVGFGLGARGWGGGVLAGYGYGGFTQNGHMIPLRAMAFAHFGPIALRLSGYLGWRFHLAGEYPGGERHALGTNLFGADLSTIVMRSNLFGNGGGLAIGVGLDRQDDVTVTWLTVGLGVAAADIGYDDQYAQ